MERNFEQVPMNIKRSLKSKREWCLRSEYQSCHINCFGAIFDPSGLINLMTWTKCKHSHGRS